MLGNFDLNELRCAQFNLDSREADLFSSQVPVQEKSVTGCRQ